MKGPPPNDVVVAGGDISRFGLFLEASLADIATPVIGAAIRDAMIEAADIQAAFVGNAFGGLINGQETILGQLLLNAAFVRGIPVQNVKGACSSGAAAAHLAWGAVAYGQYQCALVLGVEKMSDPDRGRALRALATAADREPPSPVRSVFMDVNAERARRYMADHGATARHFAMCAVKNRRHAGLNERAAQRAPLTIDQVLGDRVIVEPLTRSMCGGVADGAAAAIFVSGDFARRRGLKGPRILASTFLGGDASAADGTVTARAGRAAFEQAGVDPCDISLAEVHDPTAPQEFLDVEKLGLCEPGGAVRLVEAGATSLGGRLPVNVSGGLASRGHPVGATGVAQIVEIARQLGGRAGASQVDGARLGIAQMAGGLVGRDSAACAVHILSRD